MKTIFVILFSLFVSNLYSQNDFNILPIQPASLSDTIGKHTKIEFKLIDLPISLQSDIDSFLNWNQGNLTSGKVGLNPFIEWDIDVEATFTHTISGTTKKVDGFFSSEYNRSPGVPNAYIEPHMGGISILGHSWTEIPSERSFLIRAALPDTGIWNCSVEIKENSGTIIYTAPGFSINVGDSNNPGYMYIGSSNKRFRLGDEPFNPVGQNLVFPGNHRMEAISWIGPHDYASSLAYEEWFDEILPRFADNGGNYYRLLLAPTEFDIEYEKLGNYFDRLHYAQEIDNTIEHAELNDIKIHFNMMLHFPLEYDSPYVRKDWTFPEIVWCYNDDSQLGLSLPTEMLTDSLAIKYWEQRIRYIVSRWGYSTSIGAFQLMSEINNIGVDAPLNYVPYEDQAGIPEEVASWNDRMANYIKNDLGHLDHLVCASYTGWPDILDSTHSFQSIDFVDVNRYTSLHDRFNILQGDAATITTEYSKPFVNSEFGAAFFGGDICAEIDWIRDIWMGAMIGTAVSMPWEFPWGHDTNKMDFFFSQLGRAKMAIEDVDVDIEAYNSYFTADSDNLMQCAYWSNEVGSTGRYSVGVIDNRTVNFYTNGCTTGSNIIVENVPLNARTVQPFSGSTNPFINVYTTSYDNDLIVDYYDVLTGDYISSETLPFGQGFVPLNYPVTDSTRPMILFKIYPSQVNQVDFVTDLANDIKIYPNPTKGIVTISVDNQDDDVKVTLFDLMGKEITEEQKFKGTTVIDIGTATNGVYILRISNNEGTLVKRIVKQN